MAARRKAQGARQAILAYDYRTMGAIPAPHFRFGAQGNKSITRDNGEMP